jgi:hypothetical protein
LPFLVAISKIYEPRVIEDINDAKMMPNGRLAELFEGLSAEMRIPAQENTMMYIDPSRKVVT